MRRLHFGGTLHTAFECGRNVCWYVLSQSAVLFIHDIHVVSNNTFEHCGCCRRMPDPFILNSRGNAHASLGQWQGAPEIRILSRSTTTVTACVVISFLCVLWLSYGLVACGTPVDSTYMFAEAREDYLSSAAGFQAAKGFRGRRGSTTMRLDGSPSWPTCDVFVQLWDT